MHTIDEIDVRGGVDACFRAAADVEQWPRILPHYRWVRFREKRGFGTGRVEMAARRDLGPFRYPVWWVSEMHVDEAQPAVLYRHVEGITTGMDVAWSFRPLVEGGTRIRIVHDWSEGPAWPVTRRGRRMIASAVIGPVFIHHVASRTLRGIQRHVEQTPQRESAV